MNNTAPNIEDIFPVSPIQHGMLFHARYAPSSGMYIEQRRCRLHGNLDIENFRRAWERVVAHHQALRTAFFEEDLDEPMQVVFRELQLPFDYFDWRGLLPHEVSDRLESLCCEDRHAAFNLARAPLMRVKLCQTGETDYEFIWTFHHLVIDGWSLPLILKEMLAQYDALCKGQTLPLQPVKSFRGYVTWLKQQSLEQAEAYWRDVLQGFNLPTPLGLESTERSRSPEENTYACEVLQLPDSLSDSVQTFAKRHGLTVTTLLIGAWSYLLGRYSGKFDVVFGLTSSGRPPELPGIDEIVGCFFCVVPLRVSLSPQMDTVQWLTGIQEAHLHARRYEYAPMVQIQKWSDVPPGLPLFESVVVVQNFPWRTLSNARRETPIDDDLVERHIELRADNVSYIEHHHLPLAFTAEPGSGATLRLDYDGSRFSSHVMKRLLNHLQNVLSEITVKNAAQLGAISLQSPAERQQSLTAWNEPEARELGDHFHRLFEAQVDRTPDAVAIVAGDQCLSYRELNRQANRLAHNLCAQGMAPERSAAVCLSRSLDAVIGLLGILKCGGTFVPLDPHWPLDRLQFVCTDAKAGLLLTSRHLQRNFEGLSAEIVFLEDQLDPHKMPDSNLERSFSDETLAYVYYTSGSTGKPKGVMVTHRGMLNHLYAKIDDLKLDSRDIVAQTASQCFDIYVWQCLAPLLLGGQVRIYSDEVAHLPHRLLAAIEEHHVTVLETVPSLLKPALELDARGPNLDSLRWLISTGEALEPSLCRKFFQKFPRIPIVNAWGATECSDDVTHFVIQEPPVGNALSVPIGRQPICNTRVYVFDQWQDLAAEEIAGELHIAGEAVGRGYLNRPDLTASTFVPDPFSARPGARIYKTGDLGKRALDGAIHYHGRKDAQVKVRGFRVELSEIEALLDAHPAVQQVAVLAPPDKRGDRRLVAYVVPKREPQQLSTGNLAVELKSYLERGLPPYMVPSAFVQLDEFPLSESGKLDRKALAAFDQGLEELAGTYQPPQTPTEQALLSIWQAVLGTNEIGVNSNFFHVGGHSLLAMRVIARISEKLGVDLTLPTLFESPTIQDLAKKIEQLRGSDEHSQLPPIRVASRQQTLPLSYAQQRLWLLDQFQPDGPYTLPVSIRLTGRLDIPTLIKCLNTIVARHESLRTTINVVQGVPAQQIHPQQIVDLPYVDVGSLDGDTRERFLLQLMKEEAKRRFDLQTGPLLRGQLIRVGVDDHLLLATIHHIVSDGWSTDILKRELAVLYDAFTRGEEPALPALPIQYADYACWYREWLQGERLEQAIRYWRAQLDDIAALELPLDRPRLAHVDFDGMRYKTKISASLRDRLNELSRTEGATLFMTLLAAFKTLMFQSSGQTDIAVGAPIAGRTHRELENLIGFFVNVLVLRTRLHGNPTFREILRRVRDTTLEAYAHSHVPFEKLVEELNPKRDLTRHPLFDVAFALHKFEPQTFQLRDLTMSIPEIEATIAPFDLRLELNDGDAGIEVLVEYRKSLFDAPTIQRMMHRYVNLLECLVADADLPLKDIPRLSEAEREEQLIRWNDTAREFPAAVCIHELFEDAVRKWPDRIAVDFDGNQVTYRAINARANRLAHYLRTMGVGPDSLVGICVDRSVEMIHAVLAVLKAGGAYLPISKDNAQKRISAILADARPSVVITLTAYEDDFRSHEYQTVLLDGEAVASSAPNHGNPRNLTSADNLAYVIFTSGSTGRPNGVMVGHRQLCNLAAAHNREFRIESDGVVLQFASLGFDASVSEIFSTLPFGARLCSSGLGSLRPGSGLVKYLTDHQITNVILPPSLLACMETTSLPALRTLVVAGEACPADVVRQWHAGRTMINAYGPTETTVGASFSCCDLAQDPPTIGRPSGNVQIHILDQKGDLIPTGNVGEIVIGGMGVSRGYLNQPRLTASKFLPNPFAKSPGCRMYSSGDLGRFRSSGDIEFHGRTDRQVKLRGYRIELEDITHAIERHASVQRAYVQLTNNGEHTAIVAYCACLRDPTLSEASLRQHVQDLLPEYMVPAHFHILDTLPLNANGKIDVEALESLGSPRVSLVGQWEPHTEIERRLARIWSELLKRPDISVQDDFFQLGGHSLLVPVLAVRIEQEFGKTLPGEFVFQSPRLYQQAELLGDPRARSREQDEQLRHQDKRLSLVCLNYGPNIAQQLSSDWNVTILNELNHALLQQAVEYDSIEQMASCCVEDLFSVKPSGPYNLVGYCGHAVIAYEMAQQLRASGEEVSTLILIDPAWLWVEMRDRVHYVSERLKHHAQVLKRVKLVQHLPYYLRLGRSGFNLAFQRDILNDYSEEAWAKIGQKVRKYTPRKYDGRTMLFFANPPPQESTFQDVWNYGRTTRWQELLTGEVVVNDIPCQHLKVFEEPYVRMLIQGILDEIARPSVEAPEQLVAVEA